MRRHASTFDGSLGATSSFAPMENPPKVSVCIPTYNYAHFLGQAVESVLAQTFEDFELIVRDDASTDGTAEVMARYASDPRIRFTVNEVNAGLFANFNDIAREARGEYIKYLCADDWIEPEFLAKTVALLDADPTLPLAATANWLVDIEGQRTAAEQQPYGDGPSVPAQTVFENATVGYNPIGMPSNTLVRTASLLESGGFEAEYAPAADVQLWFKLLAGGDLAWIPDRLAMIRIHDQHTHSYGGGADDSIMRVWSAAPGYTGGAITEELARRGKLTEASRFVMYACKSLLRGKLSEAQSELTLSSPFVRPTRAVLAFFARLPKMGTGRINALRAAKAGRYVVYAPGPTVGEPRSDDPDKRDRHDEL